MSHRTKQRMMNRGHMLFVTCICMLFIIIAPNVAAQGLGDDIVPARTIFLEAVDGNKSAVRATLAGACPEPKRTRRASAIFLVGLLTTGCFLFFT